MFIFYLEMITSEKRMKRKTYRRPLLCQPDGTIEAVTGLQDCRLRRVQTLPFLGGGDDTLHIFLHAGYRATLDASTTGGGAGRPGTALPSEIGKVNHKISSRDYRNQAISAQTCQRIPWQGVVEVIWHDLLVAITKRQNQLVKLGFIVGLQQLLVS